MISGKKVAGVMYTHILKFELSKKKKHEEKTIHGLHGYTRAGHIFVSWAGNDRRRPLAIIKNCNHFTTQLKIRNIAQRNNQSFYL